MNHTQPVPCCPQCGRPVYRSHTCRVSRMPDLPERHLSPVPTAPPLQLVPMPEGWKAQALAGMHPAPDYDDVPDAYWPPLAQVETPDLEWDDDTTEAGA